MTDAKLLHYWEVWYPRAAATGILVARGRLEPTDRLILHAAPEIATVEVNDDEHHPVAKGVDLQRTQDTPMCLLRREGDRITREDIWPTDADMGTPVLLPGGEVGILKGWWNAEDRMEWRWQAEFYNSLR
ncbi:MAG: hypothetical protein Q7T33_07240 [Dehalococcoidia bacterium]|nr:hypothetical protein [Dehalococcoidia bacterium]